MVNRSDRRLQILIYPTAAVRSQQADEEHARKFPSWLVLKHAHPKAECTDAVVTLNMQTDLAHRRESMYGYRAATHPVRQTTRNPFATGGVHIGVHSTLRGSIANLASFGAGLNRTGGSGSMRHWPSRRQQATDGTGRRAPRASRDAGEQGFLTSAPPQPELIRAAFPAPTDGRLCPPTSPAGPPTHAPCPCRRYSRPDRDTGSPRRFAH
jgi:hypothetical protein